MIPTSLVLLNLLFFFAMPELHRDIRNSLSLSLTSSISNANCTPSMSLKLMYAKPLPMPVYVSRIILTWEIGPQTSKVFQSSSSVASDKKKDLLRKQLIQRQVNKSLFLRIHLKELPLRKTHLRRSIKVKHFRKCFNASESKLSS